MDIANIEDLMVIIWTIGELKTNSFNEINNLEKNV